MMADTNVSVMDKFAAAHVFDVLNTGDIAAPTTLTLSVAELLRRFHREYSNLERDYLNGLAELVDGEQWKADDAALPGQMMWNMAVHAAYQLGYLAAQQEAATV